MRGCELGCTPYAEGCIISGDGVGKRPMASGRTVSACPSPEARRLTLVAHVRLRLRPGRGGLTAHTTIESRVGDGECFGVLVLSMVFLRMDLLVLLEILRALERLFADLSHMR